MANKMPQYEPYKPIYAGRKTPITPRQMDVLNYLREHIEQHGFAPSHIDICRYFGMSSSRSAATHLQELEAKGAISIARGIARGIRILDDTRLAVA